MEGAWSVPWVPPPGSAILRHQLDSLTSSLPLEGPQAYGVLEDLCPVTSPRPARLVPVREGGPRLPRTRGASQDILSTYWVMGAGGWEASQCELEKTRSLSRVCQGAGSGRGKPQIPRPGTAV